MAKKKINSKKKGNRGELECVKIFNKHFNTEEFKRTPGSGMYVGGQNRELNSGLSEEAKLLLSSDIMTPPDFNFVIEHKFYNEASFWDLFNENSNLYSWTKQVVGDAEFVEKEPLLIIKYNRHKRIVLVKRKISNYIFEWNGWFCIELDKLLNQEKRDFWFNER